MIAACMPLPPLRGWGKQRMRIVVISGRSGSGKTTALQLLEDVILPALITYR